MSILLMRKKKKGKLISSTKTIVQSNKMHAVKAHFHVQGHQVLKSMFIINFRLEKRSLSIKKLLILGNFLYLKKQITSKSLGFMICNYKINTKIR